VIDVGRIEPVSEFLEPRELARQLRSDRFEPLDLASRDSDQLQKVRFPGSEGGMDIPEAWL
jgi:hypothetical protein